MNKILTLIIIAIPMMSQGGLDTVLKKDPSITNKEGLVSSEEMMSHLKSLAKNAVNSAGVLAIRTLNPITGDITEMLDSKVDWIKQMAQTGREEKKRLVDGAVSKLEEKRC